MQIVSLTRSAQISPISFPSYAFIRIASQIGETPVFKSESSKETIQFRTRQIANGWTSQQRAERKRAGVACRTWLLSILKDSQVN